jgi:hypothetical protein
MAELHDVAIGDRALEDIALADNRDCAKTINAWKTQVKIKNTKTKSIIIVILLHKAWEF